MGWNLDMGAAPKDRPILARLVKHEHCPHCSDEGRLCLHHAHAEGLSEADAGPNVIVWGGAWEDGWEDGGGSLPDWWFVIDSEYEIAAMPVAWCEIPEWEAR